eukprot:TRINITY_DN94426_c0_g1_i1.p1 TRINITY_DN94426_c0_g1~~TRINITY_DN94426_c0_g1_i1.p1  ORF type:complete len:783 (-),score=118.36 TRINITY_DN94426_c0_g1_i1:28-2352(-)
MQGQFLPQGGRWSGSHHNNSGATTTSTTHYTSQSISAPLAPAPRFLEELETDEVVTVSIDSAQLTTVVNTLMRTIRSQSQIIENLDREFRTRRGEVDKKLVEIDHRNTSDFRILKEALKALSEEVTAGRQEENVQRVHEVVQVLQETFTTENSRNTQEIHLVSDQVRIIAEELKSFRDFARQIGDEGDRREHVMREQFALLSDDFARQAEANHSARKAFEENLAKVFAEIDSLRLRQAAEVAAVDTATALANKVSAELNHFAGSTREEQKRAWETAVALTDELRRLRTDVDSQHGAQLAQNEHLATLAIQLKQFGSVQTRLVADFDTMRQLSDEQFSTFRVSQNDLHHHIETVKDYVAQLDSELSQSRSLAEQNMNSFRINQDTLGKGLEAVRSLAEGARRNTDLLGAHVDDLKLGFDSLAKDSDDLLSFLGLTKSAVSQAQKSGTQVELLLGTPVMRRLQVDLSAKLLACERRIDEFEQVIGSMGERVERSAVQHMYDVLSQHIEESTKDAHAHVDELRVKVSNRLCEMEDLRAKRDADVDHVLSAYRDQLNGIRGEQATIRGDLEVMHLKNQELLTGLGKKAEMDRLMHLASHLELANERLGNSEKQLDSALYRLTTLEREVLTQSKQVATKSELLLLENRLAEFRISAPPLPQSPSARSAVPRHHEVSLERREVVSTSVTDHHSSASSVPSFAPTPALAPRLSPGGSYHSSVRRTTSYTTPESPRLVVGMPRLSQLSPPRARRLPFSIDAAEGSAAPASTEFREVTRVTVG